MQIGIHMYKKRGRKQDTKMGDMQKEKVKATHIDTKKDG